MALKCSSANYKKIHFCFICLRYFFSVHFSIGVNTVTITEVNDLYSTFTKPGNFIHFKWLCQVINNEIYDLSASNLMHHSKYF